MLSSTSLSPCSLATNIFPRAPLGVLQQLWLKKQTTVLIFKGIHSFSFIPCFDSPFHSFCSKLHRSATHWLFPEGKFMYNKGKFLVSLKLLFTYARYLPSFPVTGTQEELAEPVEPAAEAMGKNKIACARFNSTSLQHGLPNKKYSVFQSL